jgi:hypothetical protein
MSGSASRTSRRPRLIPAGVCGGGPRRRRTCVARRRRTCVARRRQDARQQWLGFWEPAPGWWWPLIKGRAHLLACGPRLGGGAGERGRDRDFAWSPARARCKVRDDKGGPPVSDRGGGRRSGPCWGVTASLGRWRLLGRGGKQAGRGGGSGLRRTGPKTAVGQKKGEKEIVFHFQDYIFVKKNNLEIAR